MTPGRTAPEVSFAAPAMALCGAAGAGSANHTRATSDASETLRRMFPSLLERVEPNGTPTAPHQIAHQHGLPNTQVTLQRCLVTAFSRACAIPSAPRRGLRHP